MEDIFMGLLLIALVSGIYFGVKKRWKELGISAIVLVISFVGFNMTYEEEVEAEQPETEEVVEVEEVVDEPEEVEEEPEKDEAVVDDKLITEINEEISRMVEWDHGLALGTMDGDGNEIEDGEPDEFYAHTLYISDITYDGSGLELQTNADFLTLNDDDKKIVANHAQNVAQSVVSQKEEWDVSSSKHTKRLFLTIMNGNMQYGRSKALDTSEFKWNE